MYFRNYSHSEKHYIYKTAYVRINNGRCTKFKLEQRITLRMERLNGFPRHAESSGPFSDTIFQFLR